MKKMQCLKGIIESIDQEKILVASEQGGEEFYFHPHELPDVEVGQALDLLISSDTNTDGFSSVLVNKVKPKAKAFKMQNFSTLVKHMMKTCERLKATLEESPEFSDDSNIREQIEWLEKGIDLFS